MYALNLMYYTVIIMREKDNSLHALSFMLLQMIIAAV